MRQVNRAQILVPNKLLNLTEINRGHLTNYKNISNAVYGHDDVKYSLTQLYFEKCYICECDVSSERYDIEHYLPKKHFPLLGYTWSNLHKSCEGCNLAKEHKDFKIIDENNHFIDIKLLDPSSDSYEIRDYLQFDIDSKANLVDRGQDPLIIEKATNTIRYLNGEYASVYGRGLLYSRENRTNTFLRYCIANLVKHKTRISQIALNIEQYSSPEVASELIIDQEICDRLRAVDHIFLSDKAPYSTNVRVQLYPTLKITYQSLQIIKEKMLNVLSM